jgi:hypothetical protein
MEMNVSSLDTEANALQVQVIEQEVVLLGPRVAIALTADAAAETARRLLEAAALAATPMPVQASQASSRDA